MAERRCRSVAIGRTASLKLNVLLSLVSAKLGVWLQVGLQLYHLRFDVQQLKQHVERTSITSGFDVQAAVPTLHIAVGTDGLHKDAFCNGPQGTCTREVLRGVYWYMTRSPCPRYLGCVRGDEGKGWQTSHVLVGSLAFIVSCLQPCKVKEQNRSVKFILPIMTNINYRTPKHFSIHKLVVFQIWLSWRGVTNSLYE